jgi:hypothetical protein
MKKLFIFVILILLSISTQAQLTKQLESYYQNIFAIAINGKKEVVLNDQSRVDIVTDTFAIEVDFANKWHEGIGQSLYYSIMLNKKPGVLLVVNGTKDEKYIKRLMKVSKNYNIQVWTLDYTTNKWKRLKK